MLRLGGREFGERETVVMAALDGSGDPGALRSLAARAVLDGAAIVEFTDPAGPGGHTGPDRISALVAAVREAHPGLVVAVETADPAAAQAACAAGAGLIDDPSGAAGPALAGTVARHGAGLVCAPDAVSRALALGVRADGLLVTDRAAGPREATRRTARLAAAGPPVLVRLPDSPLAGAALTTAALAAWLGARVFLTGDPAATRQALDMVASIAGHRPPAVAVRGLG